MDHFAASEHSKLFCRGSAARPMLVVVVCLVVFASTGHAQNGVFGGLAGAMNQNLDSGLGTGGANMFGWRPYLGADGIWTHNLVDSVNTALPTGNLVNLGMHGGINGLQRWSRTVLGLSYLGYGRVYQQGGWQSTQSHILSMGTTHQISPRLQATSSVMGGVAMGGVGLGSIFGGIGPISPFSAFGLSQGPNAISESVGNPNNNNLVDDEFVDANARYIAANGDLSYQISERAYVQGGVGGYAVRRGTYFGLNGYTLRAMPGYHLSSRTSVGAYYTFNRYDIVNAFNNVQAQMVGASAEHRFSPRLTASGWLGVYRMYSEFVGRVPLDPVLAVLLGTPTGLEIGRVLRYSPSAGGRVTQQFENSMLGGYVQYGFFPGNGAVLPSRRTIVTASYSYTGLNRWSLSASATYSDYTSFFQSNVRIGNTAIRGIASYRLARDLHVRFGGGFRILDTTTQSGRTYQAMALVGLTWSPGERPLIF